MNAGDGVVKDAVFEILKDNLLTESVIKSMFGNDMKPANLEDGTIEILKWGFDTNDQNEITAIEVMGIRHGYPTATSVWLEKAGFTLQAPIELASIGSSVVSTEKVVTYPNGKDEISINLSAFETGTKNATRSSSFRYKVGSQTLTEENQQYFDLCMPLAVEKGYIKQDAELAFVTVEARGSTNEQFGSTYRIKIVAINLKSNSKEEFTFTFKDSVDSSKTPLERIREAYNKGDYLVGTSGDTLILSSSDIVFAFDALNNVVTYTIPQKEGENQA